VIPTSVVDTIRSCVASIRPTASSSSQTTHTVEPVAASPSGASHTAIVAATSFVAGSIRETVPSSEFDTQIDPAPDAVSSGKLPTWIVARISPVSGSIRVTDPRSLTRNSELTTHRLSKADVIPIGPIPVRTRWSTSASAEGDDAGETDEDPTAPHPSSARHHDATARRLQFVPLAPAIPRRVVRGFELGRCPLPPAEGHGVSPDRGSMHHPRPRRLSVVGAITRTLRAPQSCSCRRAHAPRARVEGGLR
jgi:hypothetical protein